MRRFTDNEIIDFIHSIGYTFLKFLDAKYRTLLVRCTYGHEYVTTYTNIGTKGRRCKICAYSNKPKIKNIDLDSIKQSLLEEDYVFRDLKLINGFWYLFYICPNGHRHKTILYDWERGIRCGRCKGAKLVLFADIKRSFTDENYSLKDTTYTNNLTPLHSVCSNGHNYITNWKKWQRGVRCPICANINNTGANSVHWRGGLSSVGYCHIWADMEYKKAIRERDNNICQNPYCFKTTQKLHIHHIDYNKQNCHPSNLITICGACNSRANIERDWHTEWYQILMTRKYKYVY